jgi:Cu(I)-responsive transcriptional regulator
MERAARTSGSQGAKAGPLTIGQAARASGVSAKMIRHYEALGLMPRAARTGSNYRTYGEREVHELRFIRRARELGFSTDRVEALLGLWRNKHRSAAKVKALALAHAAELEGKLRGLQAMLAVLKHLAGHCHGGERPDCPILEDLARGPQVTTAASSRPPAPRAR